MGAVGKPKPRLVVFQRGLKASVGMGNPGPESQQGNLRSVFVSLNCNLRIAEAGAL